jgi:hypothetical protein
MELTINIKAKKQKKDTAVGCEHPCGAAAAAAAAAIMNMHDHMHKCRNTKHSLMPAHRTCRNLSGWQTTRMHTNLHQCRISKHALCCASPSPLEEQNHGAPVKHGACHRACNCMHE